MHRLWRCRGLLGTRGISTKQKLSKSPPPDIHDPHHPSWHPGPFGLNRAREHWQDTVSPDLLLMTYQHTRKHHMNAPKPTYRSWDNSEPWHRNLPNRPPRGKKPVLPARQFRDFTNIPHLESVTIQSFEKEALGNEKQLLTMQMIFQVITGHRAEIILAKSNVAMWKLRRGMPCGAKITLKGDPMYNFLLTLSEMVLPRVKDFPGLSETAADHTGNVSFSLTPQMVALFPEVEAAYDQIPARIPGLSVHINTSANRPDEGKLLLSTMFPYHS